jgi:hypothetical protein
MKTTTLIEILQMAWNLQPDEIRELEEKLASIRQLKSDVFALVASDVSSNRSATLQEAQLIKSPKSRPLPARGPLRDPKLGSLRHSVHQALRNASAPVRRADLISTIAHERGLPINDSLKVKVGDILTSGHDPYILRVAHGIYHYRAQS